jgi:subtilisin family serine protease
MNKINSLILLLLVFQNIFSQQIYEDAWVYFIDKPQAATYLANPLSMLSQRALDRRARHQIVLDETDVPIDDNYLSQITSATGITYLAKSKWLNAIHVRGIQTDIENLLNFSFVEKIEFANKNLGIITSPVPFTEQIQPIINRRSNYDYGQAANQINMLHGEVMHQNNYTGNGVLLAVIDAGFSNVDTESFFQHLYANNKIIDVYNFVSKDQNVYQFSQHGTAVLSTITANLNGNFVGTAPDVSVAMYVSEDVSQEMPIEETYWAEAAERADSIGVDVINTSLGYRTYDRTEYSYALSDLNGQTSFISRAANIATSKGIVVVVSAGNSGNDSNWNKIGMPADAQNVITVGAVDNTGQRANFSSIGPTADGRIKPDVMAQGDATTVFWNGTITSGSGTSFSSPIIAGMVACMIQAYPGKTPAQIKQDLISISDRHTAPDNEYGNGIPDFSLYQLNTIENFSYSDNHIYPNPATDFVYLPKNTIYRIFTVEGKIVMSGNTHNGYISLNELSKGIYYIQTRKKTYQLIKE